MHNCKMILGKASFAWPMNLAGIAALIASVAPGVSSSRRLLSLPDVPTIDAAGLCGFGWGTWFSWLAPAKTPRALRIKLNAEISRVTDLPAMRERWAVLGGEPMRMTPRQFDRYVVEQIALFTNLAKKANIKAD